MIWSGSYYGGCCVSPSPLISHAYRNRHVENGRDRHSPFAARINEWLWHTMAFFKINIIFVSICYWTAPAAAPRSRALTELREAGLAVALCFKRSVYKRRTDAHMLLAKDPALQPLSGYNFWRQRNRATTILLSINAASALANANSVVTGQHGNMLSRTHWNQLMAGGGQRLLSCF